MTKEEMRTRRAELTQKINAIWDKLEKENRNAMTAEELEEHRSLEAELNTLDAAARRSERQASVRLDDAVTAAAKALRSVCNRESVAETIDLRGAIAGATTTTTAAGAAAKSTVGIINPMEGGLPIDAIGVQMRSDLPRGGKWAQTTDAEISIEGEAVAMTTKSMKVTEKVTAPKRMGVQVFISNQALAMADFDLMQQVVLPRVQAGLKRALNKWLFSPVAFASGANGVFVAPCPQVSIKTAVPSYADLLGLRGKVLAAGAVDDGSFAYVMSAQLAATLRATPREKGDSRMIIEDNKIDGVRVFETQDIENGNEQLAQGKPKYVGFGKFNEGIVAQFGAARLTLDKNSLTAATADGVYVVLNVDVDMVALHKDAFALGTLTVA